MSLRRIDVTRVCYCRAARRFIEQKYSRISLLEAFKFIPEDGPTELGMRHNHEQLRGNSTSSILQKHYVIGDISVIYLTTTAD